VEKTPAAETHTATEFLQLSDSVYAKKVISEWLNYGLCIHINVNFKVFGQHLSFLGEIV